MLCFLKKKIERQRDTCLTKVLLEQLGKGSLLSSNTSGKIASIRMFQNNAQVSFQSKDPEAFFSPLKMVGWSMITKKSWKAGIFFF